MTKFQPGEKAKFNKEEVTVKVAVKNFSNGQIQYVLETGEKVNEDQLTKIPVRKSKNSGNAKIKETRVEYLKVVGKEVPANMKNNIEWMQEKIAEANPQTDWDLLLPLDMEALADFIKAKELEIDPADYENADSLRVAVAEEMEIDIPE